MTDLRLPKSLYKFFPAPLIAGVLGQARTRILLLYIVLMLLGTGLSVPVFEHLIFMQVSARVREDLSAAKNFFLEKYQREWESKNNQTFNGLVTFINRYLANYLPEDDNFVIIVLDGQLYDSDPVFLPKLMRPGSTLFQKWVQETNSTQGEWSSPDSETGTILYKVHPLTVKGERRGIFILAHATQGEQDEALAIVSVFVWVATGVVLISFLLAWFGTGWLLKPVRQLATTARAISDSELSQRIDVQGSGELAELAHTFNAMMDRVQKAFDTQQQFVNDAGHELRTPITIIRGHLELMGDDPQEQQETIELVLDELDRMGRLVNDMIALAKAERPDICNWRPLISVS
jgi:signal transduction histidine kinase